jgi:hypothetical protein
MTDPELIEWFETESLGKNYIILPEYIWGLMDEHTAAMVAERFAPRLLIQLPNWEIQFFEWLKENDNPVWVDLWGDNTELPYAVGVSFLPLLIDINGRGFPICDLESNDNYYFTLDHAVDEESKVMLESSRDRLLAKKSLSIAQLLTVEISLAPIDIWHFAYKYQKTIDEAKAAVLSLVEDKVLVHLKDAEHLDGFIRF